MDVCSARHVMKLCRSREGLQSGSHGPDASVPTYQPDNEKGTIEGVIGYRHGQHLTRCVIWLFSSFTQTIRQTTEDLLCAPARSHSQAAGQISSLQLVSDA